MNDNDIDSLYKELPQPTSPPELDEHIRQMAQAALPEASAQSDPRAQTPAYAFASAAAVVLAVGLYLLLPPSETLLQETEVSVQTSAQSRHEISSSVDTATAPRIQNIEMKVAVPPAAPAPLATKVWDEELETDSLDSALVGVSEAAEAAVTASKLRLNDDQRGAGHELARKRDHNAASRSDADADYADELSAAPMAETSAAVPQLSSSVPPRRCKPTAIAGFSQICAGALGTTAYWFYPAADSDCLEPYRLNAEEPLQFESNPTEGSPLGWNTNDGSRHTLNCLRGSWVLQSFARGR